MRDRNQKFNMDLFVKTLAKELGYNIEPIKSNKEVKVNLGKCNKMSSVHLRQEIGKLETKLRLVLDKAKESRKVITGYMESQGPNELTKHLFNSKTICQKRLIVRSDLERELMSRIDAMKKLMDKTIEAEMVKQISNKVDIIDISSWNGPLGKSMVVQIE